VSECQRGKERTIDSRHDESNLHGVCGACEMGVDLLCLVLVERDKSVQDVVARRSVVWAALVVREVVLHRADGQLLLESIDLVQEQDDGGLDKPPGVADAIKQCQRLLHAVHGLVLEQQLVIFRDGDEEKNSGNVLEAMYPLLSLRPLATDIEHAVGQISNDESSLGNTGCLDTRPEDVLVVGDVVGGGNALN
jgi:hypothetical protein